MNTFSEESLNKKNATFQVNIKANFQKKKQTFFFITLEF